MRHTQCTLYKKTTAPVQDGDLNKDIEDVHNQLELLPSPALDEHLKFRHVMPPHIPALDGISVFTAVEMGRAIQWQSRLVEYLKDLPITVTNPRRGRWDPNVDAKVDDPKFCDQVKWELDALEAATVICFFFDVSTLSAVSMLELGLWVRSGKVVVCCDKRFWRQGNIKLVCERHNVPFVESFKELVRIVRKILENHVEVGVI